MLMSEVEAPTRMAMEEDLRKCVICVVCGQQAHGMYFGAIVCLPCKSFFIRCTKEGQPRFSCQGTRSCNIQGGNRMRCQYCRYKRCLDAGMARKEKPEKIVPAEGQELCRVCSDIANGIHFGVMTCEGCKKFFRRALKECNSYVCKYRQACQLNPRNRNACRYCRYQKCLQLGMSRKAIRMGRPRKSKAGGVKLQSITSLLKRSVSQYSSGYPGSDSGSSDSGQMDDYGYHITEQQLQRDYAVKYASQMAAVNGGVVGHAGHMGDLDAGGMVKPEPTERYAACQSQCQAAQWGGPREQWAPPPPPPPPHGPAGGVPDEMAKMKAQSSPPQGTPAVRKMEFEQPPPCSYTGLLAEASMPAAAVPPISSANTPHLNQFSAAALGDCVPLTYDADELNEILAMLPIDGGTINSQFIHQVQNELRCLVREAGYDLPPLPPLPPQPQLPTPAADYPTAGSHNNNNNNNNNKVILNTPTIPVTLRADNKVEHQQPAQPQPHMLAPVEAPVTLASLVSAPIERHIPPVVVSSPPTPAPQPHRSPVAALIHSPCPSAVTEHLSPRAMPHTPCPGTPHRGSNHSSPVALSHVHSSPEHLPQTHFSPNRVAHISPIRVMSSALVGNGPLDNGRHGHGAGGGADASVMAKELMDPNVWSKVGAQFQASPNWQAPESGEQPKTVESDYQSFPAYFTTPQLPVK